MRKGKMSKRKKNKTPSRRRTTPKKKRVVTDTRVRVVRTTFGSLAKVHWGRYAKATGKTQEWSVALSSSLARGDCGGATSALVELAAAAGRADAEARGFKSGVGAIAREQLRHAREHFTRVCLAPRRGRGGHRG